MQYKSGMDSEKEDLELSNPDAERQTQLDTGTGRPVATHLFHATRPKEQTEEAMAACFPGTEYWLP
jgi:hypothetical protein